LFSLRADEVVPEDVDVISLNADWNSTSIMILVAHRTFDVVPPGTEPPIVPRWDDAMVQMSLADVILKGIEDNAEVPNCCEAEAKACS